MFIFYFVAVQMRTMHGIEPLLFNGATSIFASNTPRKTKDIGGSACTYDVKIYYWCETHSCNDILLSSS